MSCAQVASEHSPDFVLILLAFPSDHSWVLLQKISGGLLKRVVFLYGPVQWKVFEFFKKKIFEDSLKSAFPAPGGHAQAHGLAPPDRGGCRPPHSGGTPHLGGVGDPPPGGTLRWGVGSAAHPPGGAPVWGVGLSPIGGGTRPGVGHLPLQGGTHLAIRGHPH